MSAAIEVTVAICARNAEQYVARAVTSAVKEGAASILLIDDYCKDDTIHEALKVGGDSVRVVRPRQELGLGNARQTALEAIDTKYFIWLDADDEFLPGRLSRLTDALDDGADLVFDGAELYDGESGMLARQMPAPEFLLDPKGVFRCFERMFLPGPAWPAIRTDFARHVGYDKMQRACEDTDFLLRSLLLGARCRIMKEIGYRQYAYSTSLSRDLNRQNAYLARALGKIDGRTVQLLMRSKGWGGAVAHWALCSMDLFCRRFGDARLRARAAFSDLGSGPELAAPWGVRPDWLRAFALGTIDLLCGGCDSDRWLDRCAEIDPAADALNNLGVALLRRGELEKASDAFTESVRVFPGYLDAENNISRTSPSGNASITTHPLRREPSRSEY